jgi:coenzyme F420-0:L-glutamate ligase/coenzyme F420-1:gamma-L-glutamate ligase
VLLPSDPDASARRLFQALSSPEGPTPVVISDTFGRPWREGLVDVALGSAGIAPIRDDRGTLDRAGRELQVTQPATADQLAAAAGLLMWKSAGVPVVLVEGFPIEGDGSVQKSLLRDSATDLFR